MSDRGATVGRVIGSLLLAPWLVLSLWLEVAVGIQVVWANLVGYVSPSKPDVAAAMWFLAATLIGPAVVVFTTIRTRQRTSLSSRVLCIECWSLLVVGPLALFALVLVAASAVI
jgi:hypothetical protein